MMHPTAVKIRFNFEGETRQDTPATGEQIWAEPLGDNRYRLLNIPIYATGYAEGDIVSCVLHQTWYEVSGMVENSGNGTIHIWLEDPESAASQSVLTHLTQVGCTYEHFTGPVFGVTIYPTTPGLWLKVSDYLNQLPDAVLPGWDVRKEPDLSQS